MQFRSVFAVVLAVPLLLVVVAVVAAAVVEGVHQDRQRQEAQPVAPRVLVVALLPRLQAQELHPVVVVEKSAERRCQTAP